MTSVMTSSDPAARFLVFFRKGEDEETVCAALDGIRASTPKAVELVDSLSWYESRFAACGSWDSWALEAVAGRSYRNREPHFHGFVLHGDREVGRGTAKVASLALSLRKPIYQFAEGKLKPVLGVSPSGDTWRISTGETP